LLPVDESTGGGAVAVAGWVIELEDGPASSRG
jgi:hypothetical protein